MFLFSMRIDYLLYCCLKITRYLVLKRMPQLRIFHVGALTV